MADRVDMATRSNTMRRIKSYGSKIEKAVCQGLWARNIRYRKNVKDIFGKPDIAIKKYKLAIFIDSEFWHGYDFPNSISTITENYDFWYQKISKNIIRDIKVTTHLELEGWTVVRLWGRQIKTDLEDHLDNIERLLDHKRNIK